MQSILSIRVLLEAAGIPDGSEIHSLEWIEGGLAIQYDEPTEN